MTLSSLLQTIKSSFQTLLKKIDQLVKNPAIRTRIKESIQTAKDSAKGLEKSVEDYIKSDAFKNRVSSARKFILDTATRIKLTFVRIIESEKFKHYLKLSQTKTRIFVEWIIKTAKQIFGSQTFSKLASQAKNHFATIQKFVVEHKRLSAGVAVLLLVFLIWPGEPEQQEPPTETTSITPEKTSIDSKPIATGRIAPDFTKYDAGAPRKSAFFEYFSKLVAQKNAAIIKSRQALLNWYKNLSGLSDEEKRQVQSLAAYYRVDEFNLDNEDDWDVLLRRVDAIPASLALAQAANESAWGTSRFARKGNNYYGQWCFQKGCGLVPQKRDSNKTHEVAAFKSPAESVERYIHNLNSHPAYKKLRDIRHQLSSDKIQVSGLELAEGLIKYSERGREYVAELQSMISFNKLTRFDR